MPLEKRAMPMRPFCLLTALLALLTVLVGCQSTDKSYPVSPPASQTGVGNGPEDGSARNAASAISLQSVCMCENGLSFRDPLTYIDPYDERVNAHVDGDLAQQVATMLQSLSDTQPGEVIQVSSFLSEPNELYGCGEESRATEIHWQFVDFGYGVVPCEAEVSYSTDGAIWTSLDPDDLEINYGMDGTFGSRIAMYYDMFYPFPDWLTPGTTYYFRLDLPGLITVYGDRDGDMLPDPAEVSTDPDNADSDGDGLDDCLDPCPVDPDIDNDGIPDGSDSDIDGDGQPDPPLLCIGYSDTYSMPTVSGQYHLPEMPDPILAGFPAVYNPITHAVVKNQQMLHVWFESCIPPELYPDLADYQNWLVALRSLPPFYPPTFPVTVTAVTVNSDSIDLTFSRPIPNDMDVTIVCYTVNVQISVAITTAVIRALINCDCPSFSVDKENWNCCENNKITIHWTCGSCPYDFYMEETIWEYTRSSADVLNPDCQEADSSYTVNAPVSMGYDIRGWVAKWWDCPTFDYTFERSRCNKYKLDFKLICRDWLGVVKSVTTGTVTTIDPDTDPPLVPDPWLCLIGCQAFWCFNAQDKCLTEGFTVTTKYYSGAVKVEYFKWGECADDDTCFDPGYSGPCDFKCHYEQITGCEFCNVECVEVTVFDTCGNWTQIVILADFLPKPTYTSFLTVGNGDRWGSDSDDPAWRQYTNLKKDDGGLLCGSPIIINRVYTEPYQNDDWILVEVEVSPPFPNVPIYFYHVDPYHRPESGDPGRNNYDEWPDPLWDYYRTHPHPVYGGPVVIDCWDRSQWMQEHDNVQNTMPQGVGFMNKCLQHGQFVWDNVALTNCSGRAKVIFNASTYGGDNHIMIADTCGLNYLTPPNCGLGVSKTIEVWRYAEVFSEEMEEFATPYNMCNGAGPQSFPGPFVNGTSRIPPAFADCFVQVQIVWGPSVSPKLHLEGPCAHDQGSVWNHTNPPDYQCLLKAGYYPVELDPGQVCPGLPAPDGPIGTTCRSYQVDCDFRNAYNFVGFEYDLIDYWAPSVNRVDNSRPTINLMTSVHESGHNIGAINRTDHGGDPYFVDYQFTADPTSVPSLSHYGQYARSLMYYDYNAWWFSVPQVGLLRSRINPCMYE